jgi:hypothetical protein
LIFIKKEQFKKGREERHPRELLSPWSLPYWHLLETLPHGSLQKVKGFVGRLIMEGGKINFIIRSEEM